MYNKSVKNYICKKINTILSKSDLSTGSRERKTKVTLSDGWWYDNDCRYNVVLNV